MSTATATESAIAANKRRYDDLKRAGQTQPRTLPGPSPRPLVPLPAASVLHHETIPGGWYWSTIVRRGEALRIATPEGPAAVAFVAWALADTSERLNYADTVKIQWTTALGKGRVLFSDMGRVMLSLIEDTCGAHDCVAGGSTPTSVKQAGSNVPRRNTRDNLRLAASKHGLSRRDVPPCVSLFAPVHTDADGRLAWDGARRQAFDAVDLRAEMDLIVALSNCPHPLDPDQGEPPPVTATRFRAAPSAAADLCRTATAEAIRGFENTDALLIGEARP